MIKTSKIFESVKRQKVLISGDSQIAIPVKACCFLPGGSSEPLQDPFRSAGMGKACMVANRAQRQQQVVCAYCIVELPPQHTHEAASPAFLKSRLSLHAFISSHQQTSHSSPVPQPESQRQKAALCDPNLNFINKHDKTLMIILQFSCENDQALFFSCFTNISQS